MLCQDEVYGENFPKYPGAFHAETKTHKGTIMLTSFRNPALPIVLLEERMCASLMATIISRCECNDGYVGGYMWDYGLRNFVGGCVAERPCPAGKLGAYPSKNVRRPWSLSVSVIVNCNLSWDWCSQAYYPATLTKNLGC